VARTVERPFALAYALCMTGAVQQARDDPRAVLECVEEAIAVAARHSFEYWLAWGRALRGWARARSGQVTAGLREIDEALARYKATGSLLFVPHILDLCADVELRAGACDAARAFALESLRTADEREVEFLLAQSQRLLGEALAGLGQQQAAADALRTAVSVARRQGAVALEHRAQASLHALAARAPVR